MKRSRNGWTTAALLAVTAMSAWCRLPAGQGGMFWRSAAPVTNTLRAVAAAPPGGEGAGLFAVGDASTLLVRRFAFGAADGWRTGSQYAPSHDISFCAVATERSLGLAAVAANDGTVLLGNGHVMPSRAWSPRALNAAGISQTLTAMARIAVVGDGGSAFYADFHGSFQDYQILPAQFETGAAAPDLFAMRFAPSGTRRGPVGYAVGAAQSGGVVLKTFDGGATWLPVPRPPEASSFFDVFVEDPNTLYVLGARAGDAKLYRSLDGGLSWDALGGALPAGARAFVAFSPQRFALAGEDGVFRSDNGGESFVPADVALPPNRPIRFLSMDAYPDSGEAFAVGEGGIVIWTKDAGSTWRPFLERPITGPELDGVTAAKYLSYPAGPYVPSPNGARLLLSTSSGALLESLDGGDTFSPLASPAFAPLLSLATPRSRNTGPGGANPAPGAFAGGERRTVVIFDAGQDRAFLKSGIPNVDYLGVTASPTGEAWAVGRNGVIVHSTGGPLWAPQDSGTQSDLRGVRAAAGGVVYAVGDGGTVLRKSGTDAWKTLPFPGSNVSLRSVDFDGPQNGFVVGSFGVVAATDNGGASWLAQTPTGSATVLHAVSVVPGTNGQMAWAVGSGQTLVRTMDGGKTWEPNLPRPVPDGNFALRAVQFLNPAVGYLAGDDGRVFRTETGGMPGPTNPWQELGFTLAQRFNGMRFRDALTGVLVGSGLFGGASVAGVTNGGASVSEPLLSPSAGLSLNAVDILGNAAVAVGDGGVILSSSNLVDGPYVSETSPVRAIVSPADGLYVAAGDDGLLMQSADGGLNWERSYVNAPVPAGLNLTSVGFTALGTSGAVGYAAGAVPGGSRPTLYRTMDLGKTWDPVPLDFGPDNHPINALGVVNASNILAAAGGGRLYRYNGLAWSSLQPVPGFTGRWTGVLALDARAYVVGERGAVARFPSRSGQPEWQVANAGTSNALAGVAGPPLPGAGPASRGGDSLHDDICNAFGDIGTWLESTTGVMPVFGDTNADAEVTLVDAATVLKVAAGLMEPTVVVYFLGDVVTPAPSPDAVPGDGYLTLLDAAQVLRTAMGL